MSQETTPDDVILSVEEAIARIARGVQLRFLLQQLPQSLFLALAHLSVVGAFQFVDLLVDF